MVKANVHRFKLTVNNDGDVRLYDARKGEKYFGKNREKLICDVREKLGGNKVYRKNRNVIFDCSPDIETASDKKH